MTRENRSSDSDDEIHIPLEVMGSSSSHDDSLDHSATSPLTKSASFLADEEALENDSAMAARWKRIKGSWWFRKTRKWGPLALTTFIVVLVDIIAGVTIWSELTWEGWVAVADVSLLLILLVNDVFEPHFTMVLGMTIMLIFEIITEAEALKGFSSSGVAQIAVLFVVSKGVQLSGALKYILRYILRNPKLLLVAHLRLLILVSSISAFMNNTPIVTVMTPVVQSWCRTTSFSTSRLLMPLSFAVILGGLCTLIGTSTNLVVLGLVEEKYPGVDVGFFEVGYVGLPVLVVGLIYMMTFCYCLLPIRAVGAESFTSDPREYSAGVRVDKKSRIVGKTIEKAGLRHLPNVYLFEIQRGEEIIPAPAPTTVLNANDILYFSGVINSMQAVYEVDGLSPVGDEQVRKIANLEKHLLVEAVIASHSPVVGRTVKECEFRTRYNAAIISVHRAGERIKENIGDIEFKTGDTLLLETTAQFVEYNKNNSHFALVSRVEGLDTVLPKQDVLNMLFVVIPAIAMIVCSIFELTTLTGAALVVACLYIITGRLTVSQAMNAVKPDLLIIIAAGFAVGSGLTNSGAAAIVGDSLLPFFRVFGGNFGVLLGLYVMTGILTSFITNSAAVTLVFPIAVQIINESGLNVKAVTFALMMAASSSFATPVGYQTNIIVWGPGGYTSADFFRFGFPLVIISGIITVPLCFMFWPTESGTV